ncbi:uncharacterized protein [Eurosta solidaginis]|uniref:uncharacterized protein n=1 Tax=Eurosta solidaginis TaxID=178769 RepID=UPI0035307720
MECLESDYDETQVNLFAKKKGEECREAVKAKAISSPPCDKLNRKPPTLYTFCNHNINIQYKYQDNDNKGSSPKPCGICVKIDVEKGKPREAPCPICVKKGKTREETLKEGIKCISSALPRWFNSPLRCDPMSVCCRMLGGSKKCPRCQSPCTFSEPKDPVVKIDTFSVNYPKSKLAARTELRANHKCKPNFRCQGVVDSHDHKFHPNYSERPLTEKFYSKYEHLELDDTPRVGHYVDELDKYMNYNPREIFCVPRYTSQNYGWLDSKKLQHLEFCDSNRVLTQKVLQNLKSQENKPIDPIQLQYCLCHDMIKQMDHWKIA